MFANRNAPLAELRRQGGFEVRNIVSDAAFREESENKVETSKRAHKLYKWSASKIAKHLKKSKLRLPSFLKSLNP